MDTQVEVDEPIIGQCDGMEELPEGVRIGIVGCGGAGCNTLNTLRRVGVKNALTIGLNTDLQHLRSTCANKRILIGHKHTRGRGAGGDASLAQQCAEEDQETLLEILQDLDMVFISAGLGGGTGTGAAPVVARLARKAGAMVIGIVTLPFETEGPKRMKIAQQGLARLSSFCDSLIPLHNNHLHKLVPNYSLKQAFKVMDNLVSEMIKSVVETITQASDINLDFNDLKTVLDRQGECMILYGHSLNEQPAKVVHKVMHNPLLNTPCQGGQAALIHITSGPEFSLHDCEEIFQELTKHLKEDALVIRGNRILTDPTQEVRVVAVIAGLPHSPTSWGLPESGVEVEMAQDLSMLTVGNETVVTLKSPVPNPDSAEYLGIPVIN